MKPVKHFSILIAFVIGFILLSGCNQAPNSEEKTETFKSGLPNESLGTDDMTKIYFEKNEHDFGEIIAGETITYAFKFSNTGGADLIISDVLTSCGCTVSEFPKEPIKPGKSGVIKLTFDSRGRVGYQNKTATIKTNTVPDMVFLRIKATVKES